LFRLLRDNDVEIDATRVSAENLAALLALLDKGAINRHTWPKRCSATCSPPGIAPSRSWIAKA
jgi:Asp-tRNA(Asn)/Glu-tRNA(Gln) amidotransferase B subunit